MFESFTERARGVIVFAHEEAQTLKHNHIGTEHILLGLLREEDGLAARVLERLHIAIQPVRDEVVRNVGSGEEVNSVQIAFTPRTKEVLDLALREALGLGHNCIDTEHILLGLVSEHADETVAARILLHFEADSEKIRSEVIRLLSAPGGHDRGRASLSPLAPHVGTDTDLPRPALDWHRASMLWRPEGLELRIPLRLSEDATAVLAADAAWSSPPLQGMRREIWNGWLALASPSLLDETDPVDLRRALDGVATRALEMSGREHGRVEDFLRRLRDAE